MKTLHRRQLIGKGSEMSSVDVNILTDTLYAVANEDEVAG